MSLLNKCPSPATTLASRREKVQDAFVKLAITNVSAVKSAGEIKCNPSKSFPVFSVFHRRWMQLQSHVQPY